MFNSYNIENSLKINACSGGIYKTCKESWFVRFNLKSTFAYNLFKEKGYIYNDRSDTNKSVVALQMVICGDMEVIAEIISKEDFDKYFNDNKTEN